MKWRRRSVCLLRWIGFVATMIVAAGWLFSAGWHLRYYHQGRQGVKVLEIGCGRLNFGGIKRGPSGALPMVSVQGGPLQINSNQWQGTFAELGNGNFRPALFHLGLDVLPAMDIDSNAWRSTMSCTLPIWLLFVLTAKSEGYSS